MRDFKVWTCVLEIKVVLPNFPLMGQMNMKSETCCVQSHTNFKYQTFQNNSLSCFLQMFEALKGTSFDIFYIQFILMNRMFSIGIWETLVRIEKLLQRLVLHHIEWIRYKKLFRFSESISKNLISWIGNVSLKWLD